MFSGTWKVHMFTHTSPWGKVLYSWSVTHSIKSVLFVLQIIFSCDGDSLQSFSTAGEVNEDRLLFAILGLIVLLSWTVWAVPIAAHIWENKQWISNSKGNAAFLVRTISMCGLWSLKLLRGNNTHKSITVANVKVSRQLVVSWILSNLIQPLLVQSLKYDWLIYFCS